MKGETHEFLRLVWHFLNLEINAGTHIETRERKRQRETAPETGTATKREKFNKYVLSSYYVPCTSPGDQIMNMLDTIFSQRTNMIEVIYVDIKMHECEGSGSIKPRAVGNQVNQLCST